MQHPEGVADGLDNEHHLFHQHSNIGWQWSHFEMKAPLRRSISHVLARIISFFVSLNPFGKYRHQAGRVAIWADRNGGWEQLYLRTCDEYLSSIGSANLAISVLGWLLGVVTHMIIPIEYRFVAQSDIPPNNHESDNVFESLEHREGMTKVEGETTRSMAQQTTRDKSLIAVITFQCDTIGGLVWPSILC
jgi:hypothetical protein